MGAGVYYGKTGSNAWSAPTSYVGGAAGSGIVQAGFSTTIPLQNAATQMPRQTVSSALTFVPGADPVAGATCNVTLVGDGNSAHVPNLSAFPAAAVVLALGQHREEHDHVRLRRRGSLLLHHAAALMNVVTVEGPAAEPVSLADVYLHLRLDAPDGTHPDDALLTSQIAAARTWAEQYTRRAFVKQRLRTVAERFPSFNVRFGFGGWLWDDDDFVVRNGFVELRRPPFVQMVAVRYWSEANTLLTVNPSGYYVSDTEVVARLYFADTFTVPATYRRGDAVQIEYFAGYPSDSDDPADLVANVPEGIKQAILIGVQLLYDQIAPADRPLLERARDSLLNSYRVHSL